MDFIDVLDVQNSCMTAEDQEFQQAVQELEMWKKKNEMLEQENSRLLLEKLEADEEKKNAQKETMELMKELDKLTETSRQQKEDQKEKLGVLESNNRKLMEELSMIVKDLEKRRTQYEALQQKFKINADIPEKNVKFTREKQLETMEDERNDQTIKCLFTVTCRSSLPLKGGQALITFEEENVANKVLMLPKCSVPFDQHKVDVKPERVVLQPSVKFEVHLNISKRTVQVSNIPSVLPEECMRDRLEMSFSRPSQGGGEVQNVEYNQEEGSGQIIFFRSGVAEVLCYKKTFTIDLENKVDVLVRPSFQYELKQFQMFCGVCKRTVLVEAIVDTMDAEDMQDHLEIYFQKPSNMGGEVEHIMFFPRKKSITAYFDDDKPKAEPVPIS